MAVFSVVAGNRAIFSGLSSDTKPTNAVAPGSLFVETDTLKQYIFNSTTWQPYVDVAVSYLWQPSTLSYIPASADTSGNLNTTSSGGGGGGAVTVTSGNVTVNQSNAANLLATVSGSVSVLNFPATQPVSGTVAATQSGTWNIGSITTLPGLSAGSNAIGSVSVSNFPATQPVSGTVTAVQSNAANLLATVSGTVAATQSGTWTTGRTWALANTTDSVNVGNFPATQAVSGTVTVVQSNASNLLANVTVTNFPATTTVVQSNASNLLATVTLAAGSNAIGNVIATQSNAANLQVTVVQSNAANHFATVVQNNAANLLATVSGSVTLGASTNAIGNVVVSSLPTIPLASNASQELNGQIQRMADLLEAVLVELRTMNVIISGLNHPVADSLEVIRSAINNSLQ